MDNEEVKTPRSSLRDKVAQEAKLIQKEVRRRLLTYIAAGFGFVAGLAWNDAVKLLIDVLFPQISNTIVAKFAYAVLLTLVVGVVLVVLGRFMKEEPK